MLFRSIRFPPLRLIRELLLTDYGVDTRNVALDLGDLVGVLQLIGSELRSCYTHKYKVKHKFCKICNQKSDQRGF